MGCIGGNGGTGGPGGRGGGGGDSEIGTNGNGGNGGVLGTLHGGAGGNALGNNGGAGGGGAAAGPAIFVNRGTVTIVNSDSIGQSATAGTGASNGTSDATPVFNFAGMVNGSSTTGPIAALPLLDVSAQVSVAQNGFVRDRATMLWVATLRVTNTSGTSITGPIAVAITNLSGNATMVNFTGVNQGNPYVLVPTGTLAPGASASVLIEFQNPSNALITYTPVTLAP
jgi:hypothetical protein